MAKTFDIFVSYSRKDSIKVKRYVSFFESLGYSVWIDRSGIESGDAFRQVIVHAIENAKLFIFFSSKHSNKSRWTSSEIAIAIEENKKIIPIKLDAAKYNPSVRMDLVGIDYIDDSATDSLQKAEKTLISILGERSHKQVLNETKETNKKFRIKSLFLAVLIFIPFLILLLYFMQKNEEEGDTFIDKGIQGISERVIKKGMMTEKDSLNIINADLILMECNTGKIRSKVSFTKDSIQGVIIGNKNLIHESALSKIAFVLACIETGKVNVQTVFDTGSGILDIYGSTMRDHNWRLGGFGEISLSEIVEYNSNIGTWLAVDSCFRNKEDFVQVLTNMGYGLPDDSIKGFSQLYNQKKNFDTLLKDNSKTSFPWYSIGYLQQITDLQLLAFFNAIPNNGKMIRPRLYKEDFSIINPQIASKKSIEAIQNIMTNVIIEGIGRKAKSDIIGISGFSATTLLNENNISFDGEKKYLHQFYAYFPSEAPHYSVILSLECKGSYKNGIAEFINEIAELMYFKELK